MMAGYGSWKEWTVSDFSLPSQWICMVKELGPVGD